MPLTVATETESCLVIARLQPALLVIIGAFLGMVATWLSQKRLLVYRLRVEKEYQLYTDLWDKLFELRRAVHSLVEPLCSTATVDHGKDALAAFNAYQTAVHKGEPFMCAKVYGPAREITTLGRNVFGNIGKQIETDKERAGRIRTDEDEKLADRELKLDGENIAALKELEGLFKQIKQAVRNSVRP